MDFSLALIGFITIFVLIFILRMPIPMGLMAACVFYFLINGQDVKMVAQQTLKTYYTNYTIIAVPLFIFAANVMNSGKVTEKVFGFAKGFVGRFKGGLGHVNVLASLIFSGMTGSALADASGLGKMEIDSMRQEGYDDGFSCAITAASSTIGPIFPPSIPMVIYAMLSGASVGALFMAGMVPGILLAVALMIYVAFIAKKRNYPRSEKIGKKAFLKYTITAIPALLTPVILLLGIYTGVMTPTEAGAIAGLYALIVAVFGYRILKWHAFKEVLLDTVRSTGSISLMIGAATCISYIVAREKIAVNLGNLILGATDNEYVFLLVVASAILVLGMFIDTSVIQVVFIPIVLPLANSFGIDLVHFGLVVVFSMMIGLSTPPFGMLLFITSGISGTPLKSVMKEIWLPLAAMLVVLGIIIFVPSIFLILPRVLLGY
ncbi:TRAP transporter large permease [Natronincola ferrireducens]|uniref:TRAP transporter, DctM subunit n=1 Tax=Natronincola ferrireducens TaxID=393762 RepID=A0A1G9GIU0_9FIRM|nr:TRAP transporter large permease [Natronincola ferrireducens]SDL00522.1 TRAP transporter, DctM subunit [Natronincola ferrireducens]